MLALVHRSDRDTFPDFLLDLHRPWEYFLATSTQCGDAQLIDIAIQLLRYGIRETASSRVMLRDSLPVMNPIKFFLCPGEMVVPKWEPTGRQTYYHRVLGLRNS